MKSLRRFLSSRIVPENTRNLLWYRKPAKVWEEALTLDDSLTPKSILTAPKRCCNCNPQPK